MPELDHKPGDSVEVIIARIEERIKHLSDRDCDREVQSKEIIYKLDALNIQIIKSNSDREADIISLKTSLKNKMSVKDQNINNSIKSIIKEIKDYHDKDIKPVKENLLVKFGKNKVAVYAFAFIILFALWEKIEQVVNHHFRDNGLEQTTPYSKNFVTRGGEFINDTTEIK